MRHIAIEKALYLLLYKILRVPIIMACGLNCNFPVKDVLLYVVWWFRGMP